MSSATDRPTRRAAPTKRKSLLTVEEASALTGYSKEAIEERVDGQATVTSWRPGEQAAQLIPIYALEAAGLVTPKETATERRIDRLIGFLQAHPDRPFSTYTLRMASGLPRQPCVVALMSLCAVGFVRKSQEPPAEGGGRPRDVWRWVRVPN